MTPKQSECRKSKRGVALIVVVGFLAVMILVAVSFSISMRVERLAAKNFADVIACRQHAQSALSYAMQAADAGCGNYPTLRTRVHNSSNGVDSVRLLVNQATNYVPQCLFTNAFHKDPEWVQMKDASGNVIARYAFQIFDCSGFIDANFGNVTNLAPSTRTIARFPTDIWLDPTITPEIPSGTAAAQLKDGRLQNVGAANSVSPWGELISLADMWQLLGQGPNGGKILVAPPTNFFTYSRFETGWLDSRIPGPSGVGVVSNPVYIGWNPIEWAQQTGVGLQQKLEPIKGAFIAMGMAVDRATDLSKCIMDYADNDSLPQNAPNGDIYANSCTEATPLFNEFLFDFWEDIDLSSGKKTFHIQPYVELWYPFAGVPPNVRDYEMILNFTFSGAQPTALNMSKTVPAFTVPGGSWSNGAYRTIKTEIPEIKIDDVTLDDASAYAVRISAALREKGSSAASSLADGVRNLELKLNGLQPHVPLAPPTHRYVGIACNDPRFNAFATSWSPTELGDSGGVKKETLMPPLNARFNKDTCTAFSDAASDFFGSTLTEPWINVSTNGYLQSVGELGMIAYDPAKPWQTIKLLGSGGTAAGIWPVLGRFTLSSNKVQRGLINMNSWMPGVIASAFLAAQTNRYPGEICGGLSPAQAAAIGAQFVNYSTSTKPFTNVWDIAEVAPAGTLAGLDKMQSEGVIRNSCELLGVRQNVFLILLAAQTVSPFDANDATAEQRALAVVWRDPYPSAQQTGGGSITYHPSFVRWFHWLTD